jgi:hypothetical protein
MLHHYVCSISSRWLWAFSACLLILAVAGRAQAPSSAGQMLIDNWNPSACGYTDSARFNLRAPAHVDRIELWYNWQAGENSVPYAIMSGNRTLRSGNLRRGNCDLYQAAWCAAGDSANLDLGPGAYVVHAGRPRVCQNGGSGGGGFIHVLGSNRNVVAKATVPKPAESKSIIRKLISIRACGWATYDHIVHANGANWGSGWKEWGTRDSVVIPEGETISYSDNDRGHTVEISGQITREQVVWLRVKDVQPYWGGDSIAEEYELEIQNLPVQPDTSNPITRYIYIADSITQDPTRPHDVARFIKKLTYERTFKDGQKQVLSEVDWNHLTGPQSRGVDPLTHFTVYNIDSFVSVAINYVTPENGPAPAPR